jgi:two-component system, cell cycle response regulator CpdR
MHLSNSQDASEGATILVVEDEDLLREMLEETLVEAGYGVISAASGGEATDLLSGTPLPRAVGTDINLGRARMDGWELARLARKNDPSCVILYVSGDSAHRWAANGVPQSASWLNHLRPRNWWRLYRAFSFGAGQSRVRRRMCRPRFRVRRTTIGMSCVKGGSRCQSNSATTCRSAAAASVP